MEEGGGKHIQKKNIWEMRRGGREGQDIGEEDMNSNNCVCNNKLDALFIHSLLN
jgi:hypothetical protein